MELENHWVLEEASQLVFQRYDFQLPCGCGSKPGYLGSVTGQNAPE